MDNAYTPVTESNVSTSTFINHIHTMEILTVPVNNIVQPAKFEMDDAFRSRIVAFVRSRIDDSTRTAIVILFEETLSNVLESEVNDILNTRFEALFESVMAQVLQRQLMVALEQRASNVTSLITRTPQPSA